MSGEGLPFVPASLDDLGLDVYSFRVYAHACRRAGPDGMFFGGGLKVAKACRMSLRRVRSAVAELRRLGLLEVVAERFGCPTTYRPAPADQCTTCTGTSAPRAPVDGGPVHHVHGTGAPRAHLPVHHVHTEGTPLKVLPEGGASPPVVSITAVRGRRRAQAGGVAVDPVLEPAVEAWLRIFPASGRTGGLVQAIERAVGQGYTVAQVVQALDVVVDAKANPSKYRPKETPRFLAEDRRGRVPGFVLVPSRIDELLACVPEPAKPRPAYRWKEA